MATPSHQSDLHLDVTKFDPNSIAKETQQLNDVLVDMMADEPKWYEVGAERYRQMRWNGETPLPKPLILNTGENIVLPSREAGRDIPCRMFRPESEYGPSRGVFAHLHGGGWVLGNHLSQDSYLRFLANTLRLTVVSIGYRLAPEHPYPAPNQDCFDVAEYLVDHAREKFGVPLLFAGGESAGAHLTVCTVLHLGQSRPEFAFRGLLLHYGCYDLAAFCPQAHHFALPVPLILDLDLMKRYIEAYLPNHSEEQRREPKISPLWADLKKYKLPPALFTVGTSDCLLDDSMYMSLRWKMAGADAILKVYPGAPHGFTLFEPSSLAVSGQSREDVTLFLKERIET